LNMKISISVSDEIFELSEQLSKHLKVSRSKIFAMGIEKLAESIDKELEKGKTNISKEVNNTKSNRNTFRTKNGAD
jgi:hypothetical protein